jgi:hypothetical protein
VSICFFLPTHHAYLYHPPVAFPHCPELEGSRYQFRGDYYQHNYQYNSTHHLRLSSYYGRLSVCLNGQSDLCRELVGHLEWVRQTDCFWLALYHRADSQPHPIHQLGLRRSTRVFIRSCSTVSARAPIGGIIYWEAALDPNWLHSLLKEHRRRKTLVVYIQVR